MANVKRSRGEIDERPIPSHRRCHLLRSLISELALEQANGESGKWNKLFNAYISVSVRSNVHENIFTLTILGLDIGKYYLIRVKWAGIGMNCIGSVWTEAALFKLIKSQNQNQT